MSTITLPPAATREPSMTRRWLVARSVNRHTYGVLGIMVLTCGIHLTLMVQNWRKLGYKSFDSVIFDQAIRNYSELKAPTVPLKSAYAGLPSDFIQLGDHFSPIHALLAPLYWIWSDVRMLFIAQAVFYAIASGLIWRFTRRILGTVPAYVVAVAFAVSWGLQAAMAVGYHELDVAVPLLAFAVERLYAGRHLHALIGVGLLLFVKEEMGLWVAVMGVLFIIRGHRRLGPAIVAAGLAWSVLAIKVFVPAFGGKSTQYWTYGWMGPDGLSAAKFLVTHPVDVAHHILMDPRQQLLLWLLAVALGAQFLSPIALLALPSLAIRLLSDFYSYSMLQFQYNAPLMVILFMAGVDGVGRLAGWITRLQERRTGTAVRTRIVQAVVVAWLAGVLAVAAYGCVTPTFPFSRLDERAAWRQSPYELAAVAVVDQIPAGATVEADDALGVLISGRTGQLRLAGIKPTGSEYVVLGAPPRPIWPFEDPQSVYVLKQYYLDNGYVEIWSQANIWLLRR